MSLATKNKPFSNHQQSILCHCIQLLFVFFPSFPFFFSLSSEFVILISSFEINHGQKCSGIGMFIKTQLVQSTVSHELNEDKHKKTHMQYYKRTMTSVHWITFSIKKETELCAPLCSFMFTLNKCVFEWTKQAGCFNRTECKRWSERHLMASRFINWKAVFMKSV